MGKKILPSGEIVDENDPRLKNQNRPQSSQPRERFGSLQGGGNHGNQQQRGEESPGVFAQFNNKLLELGAPPITVSSYVITPAWYVVAALALFFQGLPLFCIVCIVFGISQSEQQNSENPQQQGRRPRQPPGHRLGRH